MDIREQYGKSEDYVVTPLNRFRLQYFKKNYDGIMSMLPKKSRILEIGPGGGTFAEYLLDLGFTDITLCEYSRVISEKLMDYFKDNPNVTITNEEAISHLRNNPTCYDMIIAQQVIEHFHYDEFTELLRNIHGALRKDGLAVLETNNCANIVYGIYLRYCDHTHLLGFTPRSLENFLETFDLKVLKICPIHMTGIKDLVWSTFLQAFSRKNGRQTFNRQISVIPLNNKVALGVLFVMRSIAIQISRAVSYLMIYPYDKSLGASKGKVFTPTFVAVARKIG